VVFSFLLGGAASKKKKLGPAVLLSRFIPIVRFVLRPSWTLSQTQAASPKALKNALKNPSVPAEGTPSELHVDDAYPLAQSRSRSKLQ